MAYQDGPTSVVEDLDPDPPSRGGKALEVVLGLLLLVGVLGFTGWQWLQQAAEQSNYAAGSEAVARSDWDAARSFFAAASGYLDSDRQAQTAAGKITERDRLYKTALDYKNAGHAVDALKSIRQVEEIQPGYKDTAQIEQQVTDQVSYEALSGTAILRPDAAPPGLYYYGRNGWALLPGSDLYSRVQGAGTGNRLVYDVPGNPGVPEPPLSPPGSFQGSPQLRGRHLVAVGTLDHSQISTMSFDASLYDQFLWGTGGVWAISYGRSNSSNASPVRTVPFDLEDSTVTYQGYNSPATATVQLDSLRDKATIMNLDPNSNRYLMAIWSGEGPTGDAITGTVTSLYLASTGGDRKLLYSITGGSFTSAQFSPDGRYALLNTYAPLGPRVEKQTLLLLTLDGSVQPRTVTETTASAYNGPPRRYFRSFEITASFIYSGQYAGDMVVADYDAGNYIVRVIETARETAPLIVVEVPSIFPLAWSIFQGHNGEALLIGQQEPYGDDDPARIWPAPVRFIVLAPGTSPRVTKLAVDWDFYHTIFGSATVAGGRLIFSTYLCCVRQPNSSLYSFPTSRLGAQEDHSQSVYLQTPATGTGNLPINSGQNFGPTLLAYLASGDLYARAYDGSFDILLEHHIPYLYDASQPDFWWTGLH